MVTSFAWFVLGIMVGAVAVMVICCVVIDNEEQKR